MDCHRRVPPDNALSSRVCHRSVYGPARPGSAPSRRPALGYLIVAIYSSTLAACVQSSDAIGEGTDDGTSDQADSTSLDPASDVGSETGGQSDTGGEAGSGTGDQTLPDGTITWHQHIAPIVIARCSSCHVNGGIAPFALENYEDAKTWAPVLARSAADGSMPPFLAEDTAICQPPLPWVHDLRLDDGQKAALQAWADTGALLGDPAQAAEIPDPPETELAREDLVVRLPEPVQVEGDADLHRCVAVPLDLSQEVYVAARQIVSGNDAVLHHVVSYVASAESLAAGGVEPNTFYDCFGGPGLDDVRLLDAWAPGGTPNTSPEGSGQLLSPGDHVILDIHYHPTGNGTEIDTDTRLGLMLTDGVPARRFQLALIGNFSGSELNLPGVGRAGLLPDPLDPNDTEFKIPAGVANHREHMFLTLDQLPLAIKVAGAATHMHYVGRDMRIWIERKGRDDSETCLIQTPRWDFNWQRGYTYDAPYDQLPTLGGGDVLHLECVYDNTLANPFVAEALADQGLDAPVEVTLGDDTLDEMCLGALGLIYPNIGVGAAEKDSPERAASLALERELSRMFRR